MLATSSTKRRSAVVLKCCTDNPPLNYVDPTGTTQAGNPLTNLFAGGYTGGTVAANKFVNPYVGSTSIFATPTYNPYAAPLANLTSPIITQPRSASPIGLSMGRLGSALGNSILSAAPSYVAPATRAFLSAGGTIVNASSSLVPPTRSVTAPPRGSREGDEFIDSFMNAWDVFLAADRGVMQGVANTANGVQDVAIDTFNISTGVRPNSIFRVPSPDWSTSLVVPESPTAHAISKGAGGFGTTTLIPLGAESLYAAATKVSSVEGAIVGTSRAYATGNPILDQAILAPRRVATSSTIAEQRIATAPSGQFYSVAYETQLKPSSFPGLSRATHFQEANESLIVAMESDEVFGQSMRALNIAVERTSTGLAPRQSPAGWTWHHAEDAGIMQLVPRGQHTPSSVFWDTMHPSGRGGYFIWGQ